MDFTKIVSMKYKAGDKIKVWLYTVKQRDLVNWSNFLNDPNPIHLDKNIVKILGLGDNCINQGPANISYIINSISYNFPEASIINLKNKLKGNVFSGDKVTVRGEIIDIKDTYESIVLNLFLSLDTQRTKSLVISTAKIALNKL